MKLIDFDNFKSVIKLIDSKISSSITSALVDIQNKFRLVNIDISNLKGVDTSLSKRIDEKVSTESLKTVNNKSILIDEDSEEEYPETNIEIKEIVPSYGQLANNDIWFDMKSADGTFIPISKLPPIPYDDTYVRGVIIASNTGEFFLITMSDIASPPSLSITTQYSSTGQEAIRLGTFKGRTYHRVYYCNKTSTDELEWVLKKSGTPTSGAKTYYFYSDLDVSIPYAPEGKFVVVYNKNFKVTESNLLMPLPENQYDDEGNYIGTLGSYRRKGIRVRDYDFNYSGEYYPLFTQPLLESGKNIKTINGESVLAPGDISLPKVDNDNPSDDNTYSSNYINRLFTELEQIPNVIIHGTPTIKSGQASGFGEGNYLQFPRMITFDNRDFTIDFSILTGSDVTTQQNIIDSGFGLAFAVHNNHFEIALSSDGTSWDIGAAFTANTLSPNTPYDVRISWDTNQYDVLVKNSEDEYVSVLASPIVSTKSLYPRPIYIGVGNVVISQPNNYFGGIINLNACSLTIEGEIVWRGMNQGHLLTTLANISDEGIEVIKSIAGGSGTQVQVGGEEPTDPNTVLWYDPTDEGYTVFYPDSQQVADEMYGEALGFIIGGIDNE